ncbi:MAG: sulfatase-like hydrolase/transferase [Cloacibacillus evryensis]
MRRGARAVVVQGTRSAAWNCHRMHPKLWFHRQYSQNTFPNDEAIGLGLSDEAIFSRALQIFREMKGPFYGFIVTLSSHHPFDFAELPRDTLPLPPELRGTLIGSYLLSINYFDRQFGMFIDGLRSSGLLDKSLVVVYGDHPAIPIAYKEDMEKLLGRKIEEAVGWHAAALLLRAGTALRDRWASGRWIFCRPFQADTARYQQLLKYLLGRMPSVIFHQRQLYRGDRQDSPPRGHTDLNTDDARLLRL